MKQALSHSVAFVQKLSILLPMLLLVVIVIGCEPCRHYNRLQVAAYAGPAPKKPYDTVKPYDTAQDVGRPFEVVGFMSCEAPAADEASVLKAMLYRAADLGADGILLNPAKMGTEGDNQTKIDVRFGWAAFIGDGNQRAYRAQAIRFK